MAVVLERMVLTGEEYWAEHHMIGKPILPGTEALKLMAKATQANGEPVHIVNISRLVMVRPIEPPAERIVRIEQLESREYRASILGDENGTESACSVMIFPWTGLPTRGVTPCIGHWPYGLDVILQNFPIGKGFQFVDGFSVIAKNEGVGGFTVPPNAPCLEFDRYSQTNFLPFNLVLESVAQIGACVLLRDPILKGKMPFLNGFSKVEFFDPFDLPRVGETLEVKIKELKRKTSTTGYGSFEVTIGGKISCCKGFIHYSFVNPVKPAKIFIPPCLYFGAQSHVWARPLQDKRALVTGGSRGIGQAAALALTAAGCLVDIIYESQHDLARETLGLEGELGNPGEAFSVDLGDTNGLFNWVKQYIESRGPVDILVNGAAIGFLHPKRAKDGVLGVTETSLEYERRVWNVNYFAPRVLAALFGCKMVERGFGRMVNILSPGAYAKLPYYHLIAMTKAALGQLTRECAIDLGDHGVTVNNVIPGLVDHTPAFRMMDEKIIRRMYELIRGEEFVRPEDVGHLIVQICLMPKCTGADFHIDCGFRINQFPRINGST